MFANDDLIQKLKIVSKKNGYSVKKHISKYEDGHGAIKLESEE